MTHLFADDIINLSLVMRQNKLKDVVKMIDVNKLKGKIIEKGFNVDFLANKLEINSATLYRKIKANGESLTLKEVAQIVNVLNLNEQEAKSIFFNFHVA